MAKSLVTGGSGFIGRHLVSALLARGDMLRIFDENAPLESSAKVEFRRGSILDRPSLLSALQGMDRVFHLAGIAHLWTPNLADFDRVNRAGTETLLSAAAESGIGRILHCSTEAILMPPQRLEGPVDEKISLQLSDMPGPYTRSKYAAERAALAAAHQGLPVVVVNPTVPLGPGDRRMTPPTAMLTRFLDGGHAASLDCILNLADVRDMAEGMILAAERGRIGQRYILGGENLSMHELVVLIGQSTGKTLNPLWIPPWLALSAGVICGWLATNVTRSTPAATAEGVRLALRSRPVDIGKARRELGYAPRKVEPALAEALAWLTKQGRNMAQN
jgi:nucleoside-diphosphate-sugar epimerase